MPAQTKAVLAMTLNRVGIAAGRGGFELKEFLAGKLRDAGYAVSDFGDRELKPGSQSKTEATWKWHGVKTPWNPLPPRVRVQS